MRDSTVHCVPGPLDIGRPTRLRIFHWQNPKGPFGCSASASRPCENCTIMLTDSCALLPKSTLATRPSKIALQPNEP
jgi:hypothetical protein